MAVPFDIKINVKDALKGIEKEPKEKKEQINTAIHNAGFLVEGEVKSSIAGQRAEPRSVDTGKFMGTVWTDNSKEFSSQIISPVEYGIYLEEGTSKIPARHHFLNSKNRKEKEILNIIKEAIK